MNTDRTQEGLDETLAEYEIVDQIEEKYLTRKRRHRRKIAGTIAVIALLLAAVLLVLIFQTYDSVQLLESHDLSDAGNNGYLPFAGKILKYNGDGVSLMNSDGVDKWNQAVQMQQPSAAVNGECAVVADLSGSTACVFDGKGLTAQIQTTKLIQRAAVGKDGTTALIQENGSTPVVSCYDPDGALVLKHQASLSGSGYPISAAVSDDGEVLALSYLKPGGSGASGKIAFFDIKEKKKDNLLCEEKLGRQAAGEVFFTDESAVVIAEKQCILYEVGKTPEKKKTIRIQGEIEKVFHDREYFGFTVRSESGDRKLLIYSGSGAKKLEKQIQGSYDKVVFSDKRVILYSGQECCIYTLRGIHRFDGQLRDGTLFVMPLGGINRYAVITNDGIDTVFLKR